MNVNKTSGGRRAKSRGQMFERIISYNAELSWWEVIQIPDGCKVIGAQKFIRVKSPFDFVLAKDEKAIFCDAKTTEAKRFTHSMINHAQVSHLLRLHRTGFMAGYIINFTNLDLTVFVDAGKLIEIKTGGGFSPEHGILIGDNEKLSFDKLFTLS